jgi:hypothetical protein
MRKFDFYSDPSHGWLKVKRQELMELGIESQISGYSYQKGDLVFLEEDRDASIFLHALEMRHGQKLSLDKLLRHHFTSRAFPIRSYESYNSIKQGKEQKP